LGTTQYRIQFESATDDNDTDDYLGFYSGENDRGLQPALDLSYRLGTSVTRRSIAMEDGYITESESYPGVGDKVVATANDQAALRVGDTAPNAQYVSFVSFDLSDIPKNVVITQVQLTLNMGEIQGNEAGMGIISVDSNIGGFSGNPALEVTDFSAYDETTDYLNTASLAADLNMSEGMIAVGGRALLNKGSPAQFRIRYQDITSDSDDTEDYVGYWSGEADTTLRPELIMSYYSGPVFEAATIVKVEATESVEYLESIAGKAVDPDDDRLTYLKLSGPEWLTIKPWGTLTGVPAEQDVGRNIWLVRVNSSDGTDVAYLQIDVFAVDDGDEEEQDDNFPNERRGGRS
jgi:hypothetical protein